MATRLLVRVGVGQNLRTLDALQLAVAVRLLTAAPGLAFVSADHALLAVAAARCAAELVRINARLGDLGPGPGGRADDLVNAAETAARRLAGSP